MEPQDFAPAPTPGVETAPFVPASAPAPAPEPEADGAPPAAESEVDLTLEADGAPLTEEAAQVVEAAAEARGYHAIEHRSFARADADQPLPVTVITTRASLATGA